MHALEHGFRQPVDVSVRNIPEVRDKGRAARRRNGQARESDYRFVGGRAGEEREMTRKAYQPASM
jgi:hypothetical protein